MPHVGIDLEQFVADPYASGIQRVLQQVAAHWPVHEVSAEFVIPFGQEYLLVSPEQASGLIELAFIDSAPDTLRDAVAHRVSELAETSLRVRLGTVISMFSSWLLPEVSYLPSVIERLQLFSRSMPTAMIGYDALPMTDPANYRFRPGTAGQVSSYFRHLATVDAVTCISEYSRQTLINRLRRDRGLRTTVAHPGGDHVHIRERSETSADSHPITFVRLGTLEARKMPREILEAFQATREEGVEARLVFVGSESASDHAINSALEAAVHHDNAIQWIQGASDGEVEGLIAGADVFLALGTEGFGIPVLESIRARVPVLFAGIQPAAELMEGRGAAQIPDLTHESLVETFRHYSDWSVVHQLTREVDPKAVPRWADFALQVAHDSVG